MFKNEYVADADVRRQWVKDVAAPFTEADVSEVQARVFHLGPLTNKDISLDVMSYLAQRMEVSLDVQGFVRDVAEGDGDWMPRRTTERVWGVGRVGKTTLDSGARETVNMGSEVVSKY